MDEAFEELASLHLSLIACRLEYLQQFESEMQSCAPHSTTLPAATRLNNCLILCNLFFALYSFADVILQICPHGQTNEGLLLMLLQLNAIRITATS